MVGVVALYDLVAPWLHPNLLRVSVGAPLLVLVGLVVLALRMDLEDLVDRSCLMGLGLLVVLLGLVVLVVLVLLMVLVVLVVLVVLGGSGC